MVVRPYDPGQFIVYKSGPKSKKLISNGIQEIKKKSLNKKATFKPVLNPITETEEPPQKCKQQVCLGVIIATSISRLRAEQYVYTIYNAYRKEALQKGKLNFQKRMYKTNRNRFNFIPKESKNHSGKEFNKTKFKDPAVRIGVTKELVELSRMNKLKCRLESNSEKTETESGNSKTNPESQSPTESLASSAKTAASSEMWAKILNKRPVRKSGLSEKNECRKGVDSKSQFERHINTRMKTMGTGTQSPRNASQNQGIAMETLSIPGTAERNRSPRDMSPIGKVSRHLSPRNNENRKTLDVTLNPNLISQSPIDDITNISKDIAPPRPSWLSPSTEIMNNDDNSWEETAKLSMNTRRRHSSPTLLPSLDYTPSVRSASPIDELIFEAYQQDWSSVASGFNQYSQINTGKPKVVDIPHPSHKMNRRTSLPIDLHKPKIRPDTGLESQTVKVLIKTPSPPDQYHPSTQVLGQSGPHYGRYGRRLSLPDMQKQVACSSEFKNIMSTMISASTKNINSLKTN